MRRRIAASGSAPAIAPRLSAACRGLRVPGIAQVTAGCARIHLRKYCAQLAHPAACAHSGTAFPFTRPNIAPSANGRFTITATRASAAAPSRRASACGSASE